MKTLSLQDIKTKGAKALDPDEPNYLIINSKLRHVVLPIGQYELLMELVEDAHDLKIANQSLRQKRYSKDDAYAIIESDEQL